MSATERALNELTASIDERSQFLEEMRAAGTTQYDAQIKGQLVQLLKEAEGLQAKLEEERRLKAEPSDDL